MDSKKIIIVDKFQKFDNVLFDKVTSTEISLLKKNVPIYPKAILYKNSIPQNSELKKITDYFKSNYGENTLFNVTTKYSGSILNIGAKPEDNSNYKKFLESFAILKPSNDILKNSDIILVIKYILKSLSERMEMPERIIIYPKLTQNKFEIYSSDPISGQINKSPLAKYLSIIEETFKEVTKVYFDSNYIIDFEPAETSKQSRVRCLTRLFKKGVLSSKEFYTNYDIQTFYNQKLDTNLEKLSDNCTSASPGVFSGKIYCSSSSIKSSRDKKVIFCTDSINLSDLEIIDKLGGIITRKHGISSHAGIIARKKDIPCVVGADILILNNSIKIGDHIIKQGDFITLDANSPSIFTGYAKTQSNK